MNNPTIDEVDAALDRACGLCFNESEEAMEEFINGVDDAMLRNLAVSVADEFLMEDPDNVVEPVPALREKVKAGIVEIVANADIDPFKI